MIKTKSFSDPIESDDGTRISIARTTSTRFKKYDNYNQERKELAPSWELLKDYKEKVAKHKTDCDCLKCQKAWNDYEPKFRHEMQDREESQTVIHDLAQRVKSGETITLICWCKVTDKVQHCHRVIVKKLIEDLI